jgi:hypothetical protein
MPPRELEGPSTAEHGLGRRELEAVVGERSLARDRVEPEQLAALLLGRDGLTAKQTTFTLPELVRGVAGSLQAGATVDEVLEVASELSRFPGTELIEDGKTPGRPAGSRPASCSRSSRRRSSSRSPVATLACRFRIDDRSPRRYCFRGTR